jgi:hypothetical protein
VFIAQWLPLTKEKRASHQICYASALQCLQLVSHVHGLAAALPLAQCTAAQWWLAAWLDGAAAPPQDKIPYSAPKCGRQDKKYSQTQEYLASVRAISPRVRAKSPVRWQGTAS